MSNDVYKFLALEFEIYKLKKRNSTLTRQISALILKYGQNNKIILDKKLINSLREGGIATDVVNNEVHIYVYDNDKDLDNHKHKKENDNNSDNDESDNDLEEIKDKLKKLISLIS